MFPSSASRICFLNVIRWGGGLLVAGGVWVGGRWGGRVGGPWLGAWWEGGLLSRFGFVLLQSRKTSDPKVLEVAAADGS